MRQDTSRIREDLPLSSYLQNSVRVVIYTALPLPPQRYWISSYMIFRHMAGVIYLLERLFRRTKLLLRVLSVASSVFHEPIYNLGRQIFDGYMTWGSLYYQKYSPILFDLYPLRRCFVVRQVAPIALGIGGGRTDVMVLYRYSGLTYLGFKDTQRSLVPADPAPLVFW